jgi:hypothetical protein
MAAAPAATRSNNGTPVRTPASRSDARKQGLARTLEQKLEQGFTIECESDTQAVLVMKGRRRWFGLANSPSVRYEVSVDEGGRATSRRL